MLIHIKYQSRIKDSNIVKPNYESDYAEIGKFDHTDANLSEFFNNPVNGLNLTDCGIKFEYDKTGRQLYCIAIFKTDTKPNQQQLQHLVTETTEQIDRGFYGEDGWFADIGENSYYIDLVDHDLVESQPFSVTFINES